MPLRSGSTGSTARSALARKYSCSALAAASALIDGGPGAGELNGSIVAGWHSLGADALRMATNVGTRATLDRYRSYHRLGGTTTRASEILALNIEGLDATMRCVKLGGAAARVAGERRT